MCEGRMQLKLVCRLSSHKTTPHHSFYSRGCVQRHATVRAKLLRCPRLPTVKYQPTAASTVKCRGILVFAQIGEASIEKKIVSLLYHTAETSNIHMRTSEGWCLGDVATLTCRSVEASVAPRSVRGLEGLLLGAPPSPNTEDIQLQARRRRSGQRRGCVRGTQSEVR